MYIKLTKHWHVIWCFVSFIGGLYGRIIGLIMVSMFGVHTGEGSYWAWMDPGAFALVGAASFFGGVSRLTMSLTVIMVWKLFFSTYKPNKYVQWNLWFKTKKYVQWNLWFKTINGTTKSGLIWQVVFHQRYDYRNIGPSSC